MVLRLRLYRLILKVAVYLLPSLAARGGLWLWGLQESLAGGSAGAGHVRLVHLIVGTLAWIFAAEHYRVASFDELFRERTGARAASSACLATAFILLAALYFGPDAALPRGVLVWSVLSLWLSTLLLHAAFRLAFRSGFRFAKPRRVLVIGADEFAATVAARLLRVSFAPIELVGYAQLPGQKVFAGASRVCELEDIRALGPAGAIDELVLAVHPEQFSLVPELMKQLECLCLPIRALLDLGEGIIVRERLFQFGNLQMLDLTGTPSELLDYAVLKRAFDICFATVVLLLTLPLSATIALLIRLTSRGPVFFIQHRVGLNGKSFRMYKFRTMGCVPAGESDIRWTTHADPRRTALGSLLRKTSLDELPQFFNVLKGDMSVVGPRPERPHFVNKFRQEITEYGKRHSLKVGITGWAQVNGWRGDTSIEKRVEYDLYYLQNWSLIFDLQIIAMTLLSGLVNRNAY